MFHRVVHRVVAAVHMTWPIGLGMVLASIAWGQPAPTAESSVQLQEGQGQLFPFAVSYQPRQNLTSLASWLHQPAGRHGFIQTDGGQFRHANGRQRFWGTNLCFEACFPSQADAEQLARRLAELGINVVRMHHMDNDSIWGDSPNHLTIDARKLERLDYLIYQLKLHGIYTNLNLHVSREFGPREGFLSGEGVPNYDKGLDNFEPRMIELQKAYARDLLTHVNPYTRTAYTEEPAIAFVEINNENALFDQWSRGGLRDLPDPYAETFRGQWNEWLRKKYGSSEAVRTAWQEGEQPLGEELLHNVDLTEPHQRHWNLETDDRTDVEWSRVAKRGDQPAHLRIVVRRQGREDWRPQLTQSGFALRKGEAYTLTFHARSDQPRLISVNCMMAHDPWQRLGLDTNVSLTQQWQKIQLTFVAAQDDRQGRITITGLRPGTYELAEFSLRPGGIVGLKPEHTLEQGSIPVLHPDSLNLTLAARRDFIQFLWDTEQRYWSEMYRYLRDELKVRALISGTQLSYSPAHVQAELDYLDAHAYWQHPAFPGRPWDPRDWYVRNLAMVDSTGGTIPDLAHRRVVGRPYTISEYNHPQPNTYAAEGFPLLAAYGALQDWDGIYSFAYSHNPEFTPDRLSSFFDIKADPTRLVHMPACVALFARGDAAAANELRSAPLSRQAELTQLVETNDPWAVTAERLGLASRLALVHRVGLDLEGETAPPDATESRSKGLATGESGTATSETDTFVSDTGQLRWQPVQGLSSRGRFVADTPRTKVFTGFSVEHDLQLGAVHLTIGRTRSGWATVSLVSIDGQVLAQPGRALLAATGWVQNRDARLESLGENRLTLRDRWGQAPIVCEGVPLDVSLPVASDRLEVFALDEAGNRRTPVPVESVGTGSRFHVDSRYRTLWYEVTVK